MKWLVQKYGGNISKGKSDLPDNKSWVPVQDSTENVMDMEGAVISEHIPKLCDCPKGERDIVDEAEVQQEQDETQDQVEGPGGANSISYEGAGEANLLPVKKLKLIIWTMSIMISSMVMESWIVGRMSWT